MIPVKIDLPAHTRGDTWEGLTIGPVLFAGQAPPATLKSCRLYFRKAVGNTLGYGFKSVAAIGFGLITVLDAAVWHVQIAAQPLPLEIGIWVWDFEVTDNDDKVWTLYSGILPVSLDQSHDDN